MDECKVNISIPNLIVETHCVNCSSHIEDVFTTNYHSLNDSEELEYFIYCDNCGKTNIVMIKVGKPVLILDE